ncbi:hypothetical protein IFR05_005510 [Cadophora sp. M221]|nr:hypothetical protein IFR05_005510 [Cadophora sp. M221]
MASVEFGRKNMAMANIHLNGLKRMVAMRGGLLKVRDSNQCVAAVANWLTLNAMYDCIFPADETVEHSIHLEYLLRDVESDHMALSSQYLDIDVLGLENGISDIIVEARYFFEKFNTSRFDNVCWDVNSILHRLLQYKISSEDLYTASLNEACRYAVCIFLFLPFDNQFPDPTLVLNTFVYKLKAALNRIAFSSASNGSLLFWLLSVGTAISIDSLERDWFIGHLIPVAESQNIGSWKDMERAMQEILWMRDYLDCLFVQVWAGIKHRTGARDEVETSKMIGFPKYPNSPRFAEC